MLQTARDTGRFAAEGWRVRKDGSRFWASVVVDAIRDQAGALIGFAKVTRDITELELAHESVLQNERRYRRLVDAVVDVAITNGYDRSRCELEFRGAQRIKGYAQPGKSSASISRDFNTAEDRAPGAPQEALQAADEGGPLRKEGQRVRKDGTTFLRPSSSIRSRDEQWHADRLRQGDARRDRATPEAQVAAGTGARGDSFHRRRRWKRSGQLTGGVAHDFNNLLMAILLGSLATASAPEKMPHDPARPRAS